MAVQEPTRMVLVATKWIRRQGSKEIRRRVVTVKKVNRWLEVGHLTFNPKTLRPTKACECGGFIRYRLEPLPKDGCPECGDKTRCCEHWCLKCDRICPSGTCNNGYCENCCADICEDQ